MQKRRKNITNFRKKIYKEVGLVDGSCVDFLGGGYGARSCKIEIKIQVAYIMIFEFLIDSKKVKIRLP